MQNFFKFSLDKLLGVWYNGNSGALRKKWPQSTGQKEKPELIVPAYQPEDCTSVEEFLDELLVLLV